MLYRIRSLRLGSSTRDDALNRQSEV